MSSNIKIILKHSNLLFNLIPNIIELIHILIDMNNMGKVCEKTRQGLPVEAGALYTVTAIFFGDMWSSSSLIDHVPQHAILICRVEP